MITPTISHLVAVTVVDVSSNRLSMVQIVSSISELSPKEFVALTQCPGVSGTVTRFGPKVGQIGPQMGQIREYLRTEIDHIIEMKRKNVNSKLFSNE